MITANQEYQLPSSNNLQPTNPNLNPKVDYSSVLIALETVKSQLSSIIKSQSESYRWNLKHHQNLKSVIIFLNSLAASMGDTEISKIVIEDDLNRTTIDSDLSSENTFNINDVIMENKSNIHSPIIEKTILRITEKQLSQMNGTQDSFNFLYYL
eukprot:TRINITY_DN8346_c0_g1_i1.p1 TRINITY_DN8346_c0_g1~~TRINITY_DN8346_c0_g1_i1.p1  ORF type:complete len:154 (-),score=19.26 TRINITY_DN8346_c0_g1_i1:339-800(-)